METSIFSIGLNDKDTKTQIIDTMDAIKIVHKEVGDCTILQGYGFYTHDDGEEVMETTLHVEVFGMSNKKAVLTCKRLNKLLNQECIAVDTVPCTSKLVY